MKLDDLTYDPETGAFWWPGAVPAGTPKDGYVQIKIGQKCYRAHRIAWLKMTGEWPQKHIDHRNRRRADNRWANLREATRRQNQENQSHRSGLPGAHWCSRRQRWQSRIVVDGKGIYLGTFDTAEDASKAYLDAKAHHHPTWTQDTPSPGA